MSLQQRLISEKIRLLNSTYRFQNPDKERLQRISWILTFRYGLLKLIRTV